MPHNPVKSSDINRGALLSVEACLAYDDMVIVGEINRVEHPYMDIYVPVPMVKGPAGGVLELTDTQALDLWIKLGDTLKEKGLR